MRLKSLRDTFTTTTIICSLGYFVDIYDLILFSIVRIPSLRSLGVPDHELMSCGTTLLNLQMAGMLVGGLLWGKLGDQRGRVTVLYGSIVLYSLANLANAFVGSVEAYGALRFLAGIGLAGELGAAVTLVTESMTVHNRGYGVALIAAIGILGALLAAFVADVFSWQTAYIVGGLMGFALLGLRLRLHDSQLFSAVHQDPSIAKGKISLIFTDPTRLGRYLACILIGAPNWFTVGILVAFAPEITAQLHVTAPVNVGTGIAWLYLGLSLGDLASGCLSQALGNRKKVILLFLVGTLPLMGLYLTRSGADPSFYYGIFFALGLCNGYWAVLNMVAAEQFGTNLRATVAITVPNFIRALIIPLSLSVQGLKGSLGLIPAVGVVAIGCVGIAAFALYFLEETFHKELNFVERRKQDKHKALAPAMGE